MPTYGQAGYDAYFASTQGKTFDGRDMPKWDDLPERVRSAWQIAAAAIVTKFVASASKTIPKV